MKYGNWTLGQTEALLNMLGGQENAEAVLRGEKAVTLEDVIARLFDKNGRCIPSRNLQASVTDANRKYNLTQPALDYGRRFARLAEQLQLGSEITHAEFAERSERIIESLRSNEATKNILNGVYLPFCLPKVEVDDYGKVLDEKFLPAVELAYKAQFSRRNFNNYRRGELATQTTIVSGSRHERLVEAMSKGTVVGIYFPNCLQGFSVKADREQVANLPEQFLLAGGFDTAAAMIAYADVLARDVNTPVLDCAALQWRSAEYSLDFGADDDALDFGYRGDLGHADGVYSGGLVVLG